MEEGDYFSYQEELNFKSSWKVNVRSADPLCTFQICILLSKEFRGFSLQLFLILKTLDPSEPGSHPLKEIIKLDDRLYFGFSFKKRQTAHSQPYSVVIVVLTGAVDQVS
jgi:hypothetical protein